MFEYQVSANDIATVAQLKVGDNRATMATPRALADHPGVGGDVVRLMGALGETAATLQDQAARYSESGRTELARGLIDRNVRSPFRLAVEGAKASMVALERVEADLYSLRFPDGSEHALRAEQRSWTRPQSLPKQLAAFEADPMLGAAVVEAGPALSGLPGDVFNRLKRDTAVAQLAARIVSDAGLRTAPSADDPVAGLPDIEAARTAAADRIDALEAERELLATIPSLLSSIVSATALLTNETRAAAFQRLTA